MNTQKKIVVGLLLATLAIVPVASFGATTAAKKNIVTKKAAVALTPQTEEEKLIALINNALPSVVSITGWKADVRGKRQVILQGTGFVVETGGLVATNRHVVSDTNLQYTVYLTDGRRFAGEVVARDPLNDVALLKIPGEKFTPLPLTDSSKVQIGQTAIAIGNSLGRYANTVTKGIVSGLGRSLAASNEQTGQSEALDDVIQTDAAINPGNSGGPLLNGKGEVMGINTAIDAQGQGVGFAVPSNEVKKAVESYRSVGRIVRPYLGIRYLTVTPDIQDARGLLYDYGGVISRTSEHPGTPVLPGSPAESAGLQENDIILAINGKLVRGSQTLFKIIQSYRPGDVLQLTIARDITSFTATATLAEVPSNGL